MSASPAAPAVNDGQVTPPSPNNGLPPRNINLRPQDFNFVSRLGFTYSSLEEQLASRATYKYPQTLPHPDGVSVSDWDKSFNAACSRRYNDNGKNAKKVERARETTHEIRHVAEEIQLAKSTNATNNNVSTTQHNNTSPSLSSLPPPSTPTATVLSSILDRSNTDSTFTTGVKMERSISREPTPASTSQSALGIAEKVKGDAQIAKPDMSSDQSERSTPAPNKAAKTSKPAKKKGTAKKVDKKNKANDQSKATEKKSLADERFDEIEAALGHQSDESADTDNGGSYCICGGPDDHSYMIACDGGCNNWFHGKCVNIDPKKGSLLDRYICPTCTTEDLYTTWRRLCRLQGCYNPIQQDPLSKYCSPEHRLEFARQLVERLPDSQEPSRGGPVTRSELAAVVKSVKNVEEFHALGKPPTLPVDAEVITESKKKFVKSLKKRNGKVIGKRELLARFGLPAPDVDDPQDDTVMEDVLNDGTEEIEHGIRELNTAAEAKDPINGASNENSVAEEPSLTVSIPADGNSLGTEGNQPSDNATPGGLDWASLCTDEERELAELIFTQQYFNESRIEMHKERELLVEWTKVYSEFIRKEVHQKEKEYCGFDLRLIRSDRDYVLWQQSDDGVTTLKNRKVREPVGNDIKQREDTYKGLCIKRRCQKHRDWYKIQLHEQRSHQFLLEKENEKLQHRFEEMMQGVQIREASQGRKIEDFVNDMYDKQRKNGLDSQDDDNVRNAKDGEDGQSVVV